MAIGAQLLGACLQRKQPLQAGPHLYFQFVGGRLRPIFWNLKKKKKKGSSDLLPEVKTGTLQWGCSRNWHQNNQDANYWRSHDFYSCVCKSKTSHTHSSPRLLYTDSNWKHPRVSWAFMSGLRVCEQRSYTSTTWTHVPASAFTAEICTRMHRTSAACSGYINLFIINTSAKLNPAWLKGIPKRADTEFCMALVYIHSLTSSTAIFESPDRAPVSLNEKLALNI